MKKTISHIKETIAKVAYNIELDAGMGGYHHDGGAGKLRSDLDMFIKGIKSLSDFIHYIPGEEDELEIPKEWEKHFITEDPEYYEYQRLKEKFEK